MVKRNGAVLGCFGGGSVTVSPTHLAREGEGRLASSLERHVGLQRARVFAVSLLDRHPLPGVGGDPPSVHEVLREKQVFGFSSFCENSFIVRFSAGPLKKKKGGFNEVQSGVENPLPWESCVLHPKNDVCIVFLEVCARRNHESGTV